MSSLAVLSNGCVFKTLLECLDSRSKVLQKMTNLLKKFPPPLVSLSSQIQNAEEIILEWRIVVLCGTLWLLLLQQSCYWKKNGFLTMLVFSLTCFVTDLKLYFNATKVLKQKLFSCCISNFRIFKTIFCMSYSCMNTYRYRYTKKKYKNRVAC